MSGIELEGSAKLVWIDGVDFGADGMASTTLALVAPLLVLGIGVGKVGGFKSW